MSAVVGDTDCPKQLTKNRTKKMTNPNLLLLSKDLNITRPVYIKSYYKVNGEEKKAFQ
tara:strand:- start:309 stop:482 length:174 start_codon:yes stop_codon:yes gene_type:complete